MRSIISKALSAAIKNHYLLVAALALLPAAMPIGVVHLLLFIACVTAVCLGRKLKTANAKIIHYQDAMAAAPFSIAIYDHQDKLVDFNQAYFDVHRQAFDKNPAIGNYQDLLDAAADEFVNKDETEQWANERLKAHHEGSGHPIDRFYPSGVWLRVSKHKTPAQSTVSFGVDITELKNREYNLADSERRYQALTQVAPVGIWQIDQDGRTQFVNDTLMDLFSAANQADFEKSQPLKKLHLFQGDDFLSSEETESRLLRGKQPLSIEAAIKGRHEKALYISRSKKLEDADGHCSYLLVLVDISGRKQAERDIRYLAEHDSLTGLANRSMLTLRLHQLIANRENFAIVLLDLDHFKDINDSLGHQIGDRLIKDTAIRIKSQLREDDFASRLGGDEFALILPGIDDLKTAHAIVSRLYQGFQKPTTIDAHVIQISASAGIALYPEHGSNAQSLIQQADIALQHQKSLGRGSFTLFETALAAEIQARKQLETDLRRALHSNDELSVNYQPQYKIKNGEMTGVEALVRWFNKRTEKWISPADFIPLAEHTGLIFALDKFVLQTAAHQVHKWHLQGYPLILASNLSAMHFKGDNLIEMINTALAETELDPRFLELEITEGLFLEEQSLATERLTQLRDKGIRVAVDDFGTGYSNLGYLNNLPVDSLKIDRSFIDNFEKDEYYRAIVKFIIELGHNLSLDIIAEGIETEAQLVALKNLNCSHGQGYFLSRPQPAAAIASLLESVVIAVPHHYQPNTNTIPGPYSH